MMPNIGIAGIILLVVLGLLLFGPSKLPQLGRAIGTTLSEFKRGARGIIDSDDSGGEADDSIPKQRLEKKE